MNQPLRSESLDDLTLRARELARMLRGTRRPHQQLVLAQQIDQIWQEIQRRVEGRVQWRVKDL